MMIVTKFPTFLLRSSHSGRKFIEGRAPLPASMAGGAGARPDQPVSRRVCYPFCRKHGRYRAVKRRDFITLLGGAAARCACAAGGEAAHHRIPGRDNPCIAEPIDRSFFREIARARLDRRT